MRGFSINFDFYRARLSSQINELESNLRHEKEITEDLDAKIESEKESKLYEIVLLCKSYFNSYWG